MQLFTTTTDQSHSEFENENKNTNNSKETNGILNQTVGVITQTINDDNDMNTLRHVIDEALGPDTPVTLITCDINHRASCNSEKNMVTAPTGTTRMYSMDSINTAKIGSISNDSKYCDLNTVQLDSTGQHPRIKNTCCRISITILIVTFLLGFALVTSILILLNLNNSIDYCNNYIENNIDLNDLNEKNIRQNESVTVLDKIELIDWKEGCRVKVYKLFADYPCNCRFYHTSGESSKTVQLIRNISKINSNYVYFNQNNTGLPSRYSYSDYNFGRYTNILTRWTMLERVLWHAPIDIYIIDNSIFNAKSLQIFYCGNEGEVTFHIDPRFLYNSSNWQSWKKLVLFNTVKTYYYELPLLNYSADSGSVLQLQSPREIFVEKITKHTNELVYWKQAGDDDLNNFDIFCSLSDSVKFLHESSANLLVGISEIGECIQEFEELIFFGVEYASAQHVSGALFNLPKINTVQFFFTNLTLKALHSSFDGYNSETLKHVYFQNSALCIDYWAIKEGSYVSGNIDIDINDPVIKFIDKFDACKSKCDLVFYEVLCRPSINGNGACDNACNFEECNWDSGDCHQTCNFGFNSSICDPLTDWNNGICDSNCSSAKCNWDGYDCPGYNQTVPTYCGLRSNPDPNDPNFIEYDYDYHSNNFNMTQLEYDLNYYSNYQLCNVTSMLGNDICDKNCLNANITECNDYEAQHDCQCSENSLCFVAHNVFEVIDTSDDELVDQKEMCAFWDSFVLLLPNNFPITNCSNMTGNHVIDLNMDEYLTFGEFGAFVSLFKQV